MQGGLLEAYGDMLHGLAAWDYFGTATARDRTPASWTVLPPQVQSRRRPRPRSTRLRELRYAGPGFLLREWKRATGYIEHLTGRRVEWVLAFEPHLGRVGMMLHHHFMAMLAGERDPVVREMVRALLKAMLTERCGWTDVERYEDKSGAHYVSEYLAKGGQLQLSRGLRVGGALLQRQTD